jgi:pyruvate dehydrogenase E2 component (dihydrolipoamide acetyltransferase)
MAKVLDMPKLSPTMEEGQISAWHKEEGEAVAVDDLLAEVETDKATMEYRSFDKGTLLRILVPAGSMVKLGQPVAVLGEPNEDIGRILADLGVSDDGAPAEEAPPADTTVHAAPPTPRSGGHPATTKASPPGKVDVYQAAPTPRSAGESITASPSRKQTPMPSVQAAPPQQQAPAQQGQQQAPAQQQAPSPQQAPAQQQAPSPPGVPQHRPTIPVPAAMGGASGGRVKASPYVRKLAREKGLNLDTLSGTGPGGRIIARDLEKLAAGGAMDAMQHEDPVIPRPPPEPHIDLPAAAKAPPPIEGLVPPEARPLSMMRKTIARRLTESKQTVPHFYLSIDVDADPLHALREQINADLAAQAAKGGKGDGKGEGEGAPKVSFNDLLIKACAIALVRVPECNAQFSPEALLIHRRVDISVAVAVADGLVTPVVRDTNKKTVLEIASEVRDLAARARAKKLRPDEMQGGTFSISNLGMYGIDNFAAVINPPEGAILAVGQVRREPVVRGDAVVPGRKLAMTLSCDHRVVDGAVGATFLKALRQLLEHPTQILML